MSFRPTVQEFTAGDDATKTGGRLVKLTNAASGTLLIGDVVYCSAALVVDKSATVGNHTKRVGVVVGGAQFYGQVSQDPLDIGEVAAKANEEVFVLYAGVCYVVPDAGITAGAPIKPSVGTAGQVTTATPATDAGKIVGIALETAAGSGLTNKIRALVALA